LRDLTGARVAKYNPSDKDLMDNIKHALDQSWTIIAVPNSKIEELGLSSRFNLGITGIGGKGLELRNSWGTTVEKPRISISKEGLFEMGMQDASKYFDYILVAETDDNLFTTTIQSKHQSGFYSSYSFRIK
jgi:hypothetical protein